MGTPALKLIILDRDGVINHDSPDFIKSPAEWLPIPGSLEAIARLNQAGYRVIVASNQSGIAREYFDMTVLNELDRFHLAIEAIERVPGLKEKAAGANVAATGKARAAAKVSAQKASKSPGSLRGGR